MNKGFKHFVIADEQGIVRHGLSCFVKEIYPWAEVITTDNFSDVLNAAKDLHIDLLIMDGKFLDTSKTDLLIELREKQKDLKVLIFSSRSEKYNALRYLKAGANGFLSKLAKEQEIRLAIDTIVNNRKYVSQTLKDNLVHDLLRNSHKNPFDALSERELAVAQMLIAGHGITHIANSLNLKVSTIGTYKSRIYEKLNVHNIVQLTEKFWTWNT